MKKIITIIFIAFLSACSALNSSSPDIPSFHNVKSWVIPGDYRTVFDVTLIAIRREGFFVTNIDYAFGEIVGEKKKEYTKDNFFDIPNFGSHNTNKNNQEKKINYHIDKREIKISIRDLTSDTTRIKMKIDEFKFINGQLVNENRDVNSYIYGNLYDFITVNVAKRKGYY